MRHVGRRTVSKRTRNSTLHTAVVRQPAPTFACVVARRKARGDQAEEVFGDLQLRFTRWVYESEDHPQNMIGLIYQMADYAYGDVMRREIRQPTPVGNIIDHGVTDTALDQIGEREWIDALIAKVGLSERDRVILDRFGDDVPDARVAEELGVKPNNLHQIRFRLFAKLLAAASVSMEVT